MIEVSCFILGLLCGVVIVRYSIGLSTKLVYQIREDMPLDSKPSNPITQEFTSEDAVIEKE
jgi:hypothetical protein